MSDADVSEAFNSPVGQAMLRAAKREAILINILVDRGILTEEDAEAWAAECVKESQDPIDALARNQYVWTELMMRAKIRDRRTAS